MYKLRHSDEQLLNDEKCIERKERASRQSRKGCSTRTLVISGVIIVSTVAILSGVVVYLFRRGYLGSRRHGCGDIAEPSAASDQLRSTVRSPTPRGNGCRACSKESKTQLLGSANLRDGNINLTTLGEQIVSIEDVFDPTPSNGSNCDIRALLRITVPENSIIRFDLVHGQHLKGWATFHIGDSHYNRGSSGGCEFHPTTDDISHRDGTSYSDDCAEMYSRVHAAGPNAHWMYFHGTYLPDWWQYTTEMYRGARSGDTPWLELTGAANVITSNITLWAGHRYMAANNHASFQVCYDNDMVFLPKQPTRSPNNDIYFGMNRVILTPNDRFGSGLCAANLYLIESC